MRRELGIGVALLLLCFGLWLSNPEFLGHSNLVNTLRQISMLGIFAIGMGFVIIPGGIDLSIGSVIGLTGVLIAKVSSTNSPGLGLPLWAGILPLRLATGEPEPDPTLADGIMAPSYVTNYRRPNA